MSKRYPDLLITDMLDCIDAVQSFIHGMSHETILNSRLHKDAIIRNLEVLGEAANKLPQSVQNLAQDIPWAKIIGLRNRLIHEYHGVNWDILIPTILEDLPNLKSKLLTLKEIAPKEIDI